MFIKLFEIPIKIGGYANASNQEIKTSIKCATALRDTINPYLLRRLKVDVASDLPKKSEHVLIVFIFIINYIYIFKYKLCNSKNYL